MGIDTKALKRTNAEMDAVLNQMKQGNWDQAYKLLSRTQTTASQYKLMLQRAILDMVNYGGLTQQSRQQLMTYNPPKLDDSTPGYETSNAINASLKNMVKGWAQPIGPAAPPKPGQQAVLIGKPDDVTDQDFAKYNLLNSALPYMDKQTADETKLYLSRANPALFGVYGNTPVTGAPKPPALPPGRPAGPAGGATPGSTQGGTIGGLPQAPGQQPNIFTNGVATKPPTPQQLAAAAGGLGWQNQVGKMGGFLQTQMGGNPQLQAPTQWLQEYLKTAAGGLGGATRGQQKMAASHLATLEQEAAQDANRLGFAQTLGENLVNPVLGKAGLSGMLGWRRAVNLPSGDYRRAGVAFRNPFAL